MRITEPAAKVILQTMMKKRLNPKQVFLELDIKDGNFGIAFTKIRHGKVLQFGPLTVVIGNNIDTTGVVVDLVEMNGRKGLLFTGEENVGNNHIDPASSDGSEASNDGTGV
jgi:hypothetical protein